MDVMVDLETLGNGSDAVIVSIGAVEFDHRAPAVGREFYAVIDPHTCLEAGLRMDASTVTWWMSQSDSARAVFAATNKIPLRDALAAFSAWLPQNSCVWGNGASFDNAILSNAYRACGMTQPWKFWDDRCYRTLKNLRPDVPFERVGTHHNALSDALSQAHHAVDILRAMGV